MIVFDGGSQASRSTYRPAVNDALLRVADKTAVVGIIAPTGPLLVQAWQACVSLGHTPIILHYPTPKLSRVYWQSEIGHAVNSVGVRVLLCADESCVPADCPAEVIRLDKLEARADNLPPFVMPDDSSFLQMSSGTTGFRKGITFEFGEVKQHVARYNEMLKITPDDCIVSWLPLYHDMGFIAAFLMPQILGCKLVLMDPITWVRQPDLLWEAIERHRGTICYMPNFGFEVMAANARKCPSSMRLWVSCSEPTRAETMTRFVDATGAAPATISNCWGMAENIFAVCQSVGVKARQIDGVEVVSCGTPIPGVDVKTVDGEVFVRSPYSLKRYVGLDIPLDEDGFYASGDVGEIHDGEVYLQGRRHDVMINAGRKTLLSDIDFIAGEEVPEAAGRIASFEMVDSDLGTESLTILIEDAQFWRRNRDVSLIKRIIARTGMETTRVSFVPPRFVTKTSSGKINRKITRANWIKRNDALAAGADAPNADRARSQLAQSFPWLDHSRPLGEQVDSLGLVNFNLIVSKYGFDGSVDPSKSANDILLSSLTAVVDNEVIKITSICDGNPFHALALDHVRAYSVKQQKPVQYKSVCVPPLPVLFSDLVFDDYFRCRDDGDPEKYAPFRRALADLKSASVILVDDSVTLFWPQSENAMFYPQLSHDFQAGSDSRLLGVRWAGYSESHDQLKYQLVSGLEMSREKMNDWIKDLSDYLGIPVVRIAYGADFPDITQSWEVQCNSSLRGVTAEWKLEGVDRSKLGRDLSIALDAALAKAPQRTGDDRTFQNIGDQPHWCSWTVNPALLEFIVSHFKDIVVLGKSSSAAYLLDRAKELGRRIRIRPDLVVPDDCDCVVQTGSWGQPETDKPIFQVMAAGWLGEPAVNLLPELQAICPPNRVR